MNETPETPSQRRKIILLLALVVVAGPIGFVVSRGLHSLKPDANTLQPAAVSAAPASPTDAATAIANGEDAASTETPAAVPAIPERLPDFTLADRDGKPRKLSEWSGRPLMVNFWATWCAPCRREIPLLNRTQAASVLPKLQIVGVAIDFRDDVLAYLQKTRSLTSC